MTNKPVDPFYKSRAWQALRSFVLVRDQYRCVICGLNVAGPGAARIDHIKPRSTHPAFALDPGNCRTLCPRCDAQSHRERPVKDKTSLARIERFNVAGCDAAGTPSDPRHPWHKRQP
jgi:5-methylcytosine-specific restriction endonuclease McrA